MIMAVVARERSATPAQSLYDAETRLLDAEHRIEAEIDRVFDGEWQGWNFSRTEQMIEVFSACDLPDHVERLLGMGFATVRIHAHSGERFIHCSCSVHWSRQ